MEFFKPPTHFDYESDHESTDFTDHESFVDHDRSDSESCDKNDDGPPKNAPALLRSKSQMKSEANTNKKKIQQVKNVMKVQVMKKIKK